MDIDVLVENYPLLYHMAERGSWSNIRQHGLRSTSSLLDLYEHGSRDMIEACRRPKSVLISRPGLPEATIRDNKPISDSKLARVLIGMMLEDWYRLLNGKVFFWLTLNRLNRFLSVRSYRSCPHEVIAVPTAKLVAAQSADIWLTPMNTGCTSPYAFPRGHGTFMRIDDFPFKERRRTRSLDATVVELAVDRLVANIDAMASSVTLRQAGEILGVIWEP